MFPPLTSVELLHPRRRSLEALGSSDVEHEEAINVREAQLGADVGREKVSVPATGERKHESMLRRKDTAHVRWAHTRYYGGSSTLGASCITDGRMWAPPPRDRLDWSHSSHITPLSLPPLTKAPATKQSVLLCVLVNHTPGVQQQHEAYLITSDVLRVYLLHHH